jgi:hypothetical protein
MFATQLPNVNAMTINGNRLKRMVNPRSRCARAIQLASGFLRLSLLNWVRFVKTARQGLSFRAVQAWLVQPNDKLASFCQNKTIRYLHGDCFRSSALELPYGKLSAA